MEKHYIYDLLPKGQDNAISRRNLMAITGMSDRTLRATIAAERRSGALIMSSTDTENGGYYRPANVEELRRFVASMTKRGKATFAAIEQAQKELEKIEAETRE